MTSIDKWPVILLILPRSAWFPRMLVQEVKGELCMVWHRGVCFHSFISTSNTAQQNLISFTFPGTTVLLDDQYCWSCSPMSISTYMSPALFLYVTVQDRNSLLPCFCSPWSSHVPAHAWTSQPLSSGPYCRWRAWISRHIFLSMFFLSAVGCQ